MAQYPIQSQQDLIDAVNYLLSGPSGTGQNVSGFSTFVPAWIRPTVQEPYMLPYETTLNKSWTVDIPVNNITLITPPVGNPSQITVTFTTPQATAPFQFGDPVSLSGVTPGDFNTDYLVFSSTTSSAVLTRTNNQTFSPGLVYTSGGSVVRDFSNTPVSTDCNARVKVTGGSDRVLISAQLGCAYDVIASVLPSGSRYDVLVQINRYRGSVQNEISQLPSSLTQYYDPNTNYTWAFDATVSQAWFPNTVYGPFDDIQISPIWSQIFDGPNLPPDYYWYILEVKFVTQPDQYPIYGSGTGSLISERFVQSGTIAPALYGVPTTYTGIAPVSTTGTGVGAVVDVAIDTVAAYPNYKNNFNSTITVTTPGSGYSVGDILTIPGTSLGGASPANDLTMEVAQIQYPGDAKPGDFRVRLRSLTAQVVKQ